jgi:Spy/CpxP family protein refolding chaperone
MPALLIPVVFLIVAGLACHAANARPKTDGSEGDSAHGHRVGKNTIAVQWRLTDEVVGEVGLTQEQVDRITEIQRDFSRRLGAVIQRERRSKLRYVRALVDDSVNETRIERTRAQVEEVAIMRLDLELDRVQAMRDAMSADQWVGFLELAPKAVRIGGFVPSLIGKVTVADDSGAESPDDPGDDANQDRD